MSEIGSLCVELGHLWLGQVFARLKMSAASLAPQTLKPDPAPHVLVILPALGETWSWWRSPGPELGVQGGPDVLHSFFPLPHQECVPSGRVMAWK